MMMHCLSSKKKTKKNLQILNTNTITTLALKKIPLLPDIFETKKNWTIYFIVTDEVFQKKKKKKKKF